MRIFIPFRFKRATHRSLKYLIILGFLLSFSSTGFSSSLQYEDYELISDLTQPSNQAKWTISARDEGESQARLGYGNYLDFEGTYYLQIPTEIRLESQLEVFGFIGIEIEWLGDGHTYAIYLDERPSVDCNCGSMQTFGALLETEKGKKKKEFLKFSSFDLVEPRVDVEDRPIGDSLITQITIAARDDLIRDKSSKKSGMEMFHLKLIAIRLVR